MLLLFFSLSLVCPALGMTCCFGVLICMLVSLGSPGQFAETLTSCPVLSSHLFQRCALSLEALMLPGVLLHVDIAFDTRGLPLTVDTEQSVRISSGSPQPLNIVIGL